MNVHVLTNKYDICVIGSEKTGKSSLILQYVYGNFIKNIAEDENLYYKRASVPELNNKTLEISIFDSGFTKDIHSLTKRLHIQNANTIVMVYSIDNLESFISLQDYYESIKHIRGDDIPPIAIIGTKSDHDSKGRMVDIQQGETFSNTIKAVSFKECSALYDIEIKESFQEIVKAAVEIKLEATIKTDLIRNDSDALIPCDSYTSLSYQPSVIAIDPKTEVQHEEINSNQGQIEESQSRQVGSSNTGHRDSTRLEHCKVIEEDPLQKDTEQSNEVETELPTTDMPKRHYTEEIKTHKNSGCCIIT